MASMYKVVVTRNYQVTLPAGIRRRLGIKVGDKLVVTLQGDRIVIYKPRGDVTKVKIRLGRKIDWRYVEKVVEEAGGVVADESRGGH